MENAGAGAAALAWSLPHVAGGRVVCVAGPGNNGGDALVVARHLAIRGVRVQVALVSPRPHPTGPVAVQRRIVSALGLPVAVVAHERDAVALAAELATCDLAVDGLFGTGLTRAATGVAAAVIAALVACRSPVLALDLPSGLDCDTGEPLGPCVRAAVTATFLAPKLGFASPHARAYTGDVHVVGIGAPLEWPLRPA